MFTKEGKRNYFIMLAASAVAGFIVVCTLGQTVHHDKEQQKHEAVLAQEEPVYCTVIEQNGKLVLYKGGSEIPYSTLDVNVSLLSDYDREQFRHGIDLRSESELKKLIQDFQD